MNKQAFINLDEATKNAVLKYLTGGLAFGTSAGIVNSLLKDFQKKKERATKDTTSDDDILYIKTRPKRAFVDGTKFVVGPGLALSALGVGATGGFVGVSKLYERFRKKQLQKELDETQRAYVQALTMSKDASTAKGETRNYDFSEMASGAPLAAAILVALSSGVVTNLSLDKAYPTAKKPTRVHPRRVVVLPDDEEEVVKNAMEHTACVVLERDGIEKISSLPDLVSAVADGRRGEVSEAVHNFGWDATLDLIKGASRELSPLEKMCACRILIEDPFLAVGFNTLVAAEFNDMGPTFTKAAQGVEDPKQFIKLAAAVQTATRENLAREILEALQSEDQGRESEEASLQTALESFIPLSSKKETQRIDLSQLSNVSLESV